MRCPRCGHEAADTDKVCYERKEDLAAAAREFQRSLDEGVEEVSSLYHLAHIRKVEGDEAGAAELLKRARQFGESRVT